MLRRPSPTIALIVIASRMNGKESWTSAMRMSTAEGQRSTKPATSPSSPPTTAVRTTVQPPMKSASRAPCSTRARRSRPSWSVPSGWPGGPGGWRLCAKVGAQRIVRRQPRRAASAASTAASVRTRPSPAGFTLAPARAGRASRRARSTSQVHQRVDDRGEGDGGQHHGEVAVEQRLHGEPAEAGPREDRLGDDGAAEELARLEPGQRDDRDRRVAQRVLADHAALARAPWRAR